MHNSFLAMIGGLIVILVAVGLETISHAPRSVVLVFALLGQFVYVLGAIGYASSKNYRKLIGFFLGMAGFWGLPVLWLLPERGSPDRPATTTERTIL